MIEYGLFTFLKERSRVLCLPQYISALEQYRFKIQRVFFYFLCHIYFV